MLVVLRVAIGWHFLFAGIDKLTSPNFSAANYLAQAKGPLAPLFHELVPDWDGRERFGAFETKLGEEKTPVSERRAAAVKQTLTKITADWQTALKQFSRHYQLTEAQEAAAKTAFEQRQAELSAWLEEKTGDFEDYFHDLARLETAQHRKDVMVPFQQKRNHEAQDKLRGQLKSWGSELDRIGKELDTDLRLMLTDDQGKRGPETVGVADWQSWLTQDNVVTYSNLAIGACLIAGLFTRLAALGGALFLLPIVLAQPDWPGLFPPPPPSAGRTFLIGKEAIEMIALFTLATLPVGRWGGLDFFIYHLFVRPVYRSSDE
jgi:uncharacterized membrane protein YphA (DoxX/SURF4 family)